MSERKVVLVDAVRTPWGKMNGSLSKLDSADLAAALLTALAERTQVDKEKIDHIIFGQSHPSTSPNNMGHYASLLARFPESIPGYTVHSNTASGLQAMRSAYYLIASGNEKFCIAGGTDSYTHAPFAIRDARKSFPESSRMIIDTVDEAEYSTQPEKMNHAERYAKVYGERGEDAYDYQITSKKNAVLAEENENENRIPVSYVERKKGEIIVSADELLKDESDPILPVYADGAAAAMLMTAELAEELGQKPIAEILGFAVAGGEPLEKQVPGALAVQKLLKRKNISMKDVSVMEIMENSASEVLETVKVLQESEKILPKINPSGGALSYGLNEGAEGLRMVIRLLSTLKSGELGLICINASGGQGMAALMKKY